MTEVGRISVVVCSHNGGKGLVELLNCLKAQTAVNKIEVILVDDGSTDDTAELARHWLTENRTLQLRLVSTVNNIGLPAARNRGLSLVTSDKVAFTDDDCRPGPLWIENLMTSWENASETVVGISGPVQTLHPETFNQKYADAISPLRATAIDPVQAKSLRNRIKRYFKKPELHTGAYLSAVVGANMSFRREALRGVFGFDPLNKFGADDTIVSEKLRAKFGDDSLIFDASIPMHHQFDRQFHDTTRRAYRYAITNGRNLRSRRGNLILPLPTPFMSLLLVACASTFVYLIFGFWVALVSFPALIILATYSLHARQLFTNKHLGKVRLLFPIGKLIEELADNCGYLRGLWCR